MESKQENYIKSSETSNSPDSSFFYNNDVSNSKETPLEIVKVLLKERAMKQSELADLIGVTRQTLHHYLSGYWGVPSITKIKIAQALNVDSAVIWDLK